MHERECDPGSTPGGLEDADTASLRENQTESVHSRRKHDPFKIYPGAMDIILGIRLKAAKYLLNICRYRTKMPNTLQLPNAARQESGRLKRSLHPICGETREFRTFKNSLKPTKTRYLFFFLESSEFFQNSSRTPRRHRAANCPPPPAASARPRSSPAVQPNSNSHPILGGHPLLEELRSYV